jgi:hypothetical protein
MIFSSPSHTSALRTWVADLAYASAVIAGAIWTALRYSAPLDQFDAAMLGSSGLALIVLGLLWRPLQSLTAGATALALLAVAAYEGDIARAKHYFVLRYFLSSQSALAWMGLAYWCATVSYALGLWCRSAAWLTRGACAAWIGCLAGCTGLIVRRHETSLMGASIGQVYVSGIYDAFALFAFVTTLLYLYLEEQLDSRRLSAFALATVSAAVFFMFCFGHGAQGIRRLISALQPY